MPLRHGQKWYVQLLLDNHRYKLAQDLAAAENKRLTSMLRDMVYAALEKAVPASDYKAAKAADEAAWAESVQRRPVLRVWQVLRQQRRRWRFQFPGWWCRG